MDSIGAQESSANRQHGADTPSSPRSKRVLAAALVPVMGAGCLVLWLGIPLASLRVASWLSDTGHVIFLGVLFACPIAMVLWGWALYRLNDVYLQLTRQEVAPSEPRWLEPATRPSGVRRESMLLDKMLVVSVLVALIALFVWFFLLAPGQQWPTGPF